MLSWIKSQDHYTKLESDMADVVEVECTHLEGELMRVRFAHSQLVSDHPSEWGGTDTGPAPGDIILMALTSATAFAGRRYAVENDLDVRAVGARASITTVREGFPQENRNVPLPFLTYAQRFWRLLEIESCLGASDLELLLRAMTDNRIARTIRDGIAIDEKVEFQGSSGGSRHVSGHVNDLLKGREPLPPGEIRSGPQAGEWRVAATALDDRTCLIKAAGSMSVAGDQISSLRGPTPEELLLGGLAACTTVFIARNAPFQDIPVEGVRVRVRAELPQDQGHPIRRVEKTAEVIGELTSAQRVQLEDVARFCAFGVTLSRGTEIADNVLFRDAEASGTGELRPMFDHEAPRPDDPAFCDDGSCCIPISTQASAAQ